eukprot:9143854-Pyramimonas_sp.AAC.2
MFCCAGVEAAGRVGAHVRAARAAAGAVSGGSEVLREGGHGRTLRGSPRQQPRRGENCLLS